MKYSVGYSVKKSDDFINCIIENKAHIYEVYFSWGSFANGRNNQLNSLDYTPWEAQIRQLEDLKRLSASGIRLNMLFNGNCYGTDSQSRAFFNKVGEAVDYVYQSFGLHSVTTTSPLIAKFIKNNFAEIRTRASVNMGIGTINGMDYISDYFDGYYMQREYNRNFDKIAELKGWCDSNGKKLFVLANSGCLNHCSAHTFHDNLVSHEGEIAQMDNAYEFNGICKEYLQKPEHYLSLINDTNFIRPEDVALYESYFDSVKLATRVHKNPEIVIKSYIAEKYSGNILDLLEPSHSIYPYIIENGNPLKLVKLEEDIC